MTTASATSSILSHKLFPGRVLLSVDEVAKTWVCTKQHIYNLIEAGDLLAIDTKTRDTVKGKSKNRRYYKVPVAVFDKFTQDRATA